MKTTKKLGIATLMLLMSGVAQAEWSANVGYASEYYFRGILQKNSSASGGFDYESGGFYAGTWAADVGDGLEVDGYFGYGGEIDEFGYSVGYTGYFYTGDFDETYQEINLSGSFGIATLDVAIGQWDGDFDPIEPGDQDAYTYYSLTIEQDGFYGKYAGFGQDASGDYLEFGYGTTISEIDFGVSLIINDEDLNGTDSTDEALVFTIGKAFDL